MKFIKLIASLVVISGVLFAFISTFVNSDKSYHNNNKLEEELSSSQDNLSNIDINVKNNPDYKPFEKIYNIKKELDYDNDFECLPIEDVSEMSPCRSNVKPIEAFKINNYNIKNLFVGDSIILPEINQLSYRAIVKNRRVNKNGSVTVTASLDSEDKKFYSVMTQDNNSTYITLVSPEGSFEFEANGKYGYVYSSSDINNSMIDYSKTDAIIPDLVKK